MKEVLVPMQSNERGKEMIQLQNPTLATFSCYVTYLFLEKEIVWTLFNTTNNKLSNRS